MNTPHIHANYIVGWANGRVVEEWDSEDKEWREVYSKAPFWDSARKYRFKPQRIKRAGYIAIVESFFDEGPERICFGIYDTDDEARNSNPKAILVFRTEWEEEI